jgi:nucleotide-binding universal stress UspA family protein
MKQVMDTLTTPEDLAAQSSGGSKFKITHLVAPTDFSPNSERAIDYAVQLAQRLGAKVTLLHVVPEPSALDYSMEGVSMVGVSVQEIQEWEKEAEIKLAEQLASVHKSLRIWDLCKELAFGTQRAGV